MKDEDRGKTKVLVTYGLVGHHMDLGFYKYEEDPPEGSELSEE